MLLLALAWLPSAQLSPVERQVKPDLVVLERLPASLSSAQRKLLAGLAEDINSRLAPRHEFQLRPLAQAPMVHKHFRLELDFSVRNDAPETVPETAVVQIRATLNTPSGQQHQWQLEGAADVSALLAEQLVSTLLSHVNAEVKPALGE